ncbi:hypothetical protein BDQ12DRAFT_710646 [Crucibulum laeve]|uniref:DUF6534 domain-containing protein n=1 Tax=Crucibulum laeve TaxID=68775 RepID=A0A5C3MCM1_9AGAR|nr:hypothetical protein BDQ12DRAFT_710646 [Crucibulum laeve]
MNIMNVGCPSDAALFDKLENSPAALASSIVNSIDYYRSSLDIYSTSDFKEYLHPKFDKWTMKTLAYGIFAIEFIQTCLGVHDALASYLPIFEPHDHVLGMKALNNMHLLWLTVPILGGFADLISVGFTGQCFFAYRLYLLSGAHILPGIIVLLWNGFSATCDLLIALCMIYQLLNSETGFHKTHIMLNKLIRITIETGFVTATAAVANAILYIGFRATPDISSYFAIPAISIGKLYAITLFVIINSRLNVVGGRYSQTDPISTILDGGVQRLNWSKSGHELESGTEIRIERHLIQQTWTDDSRWGFNSMKRHSKKNSELLPESQILAAHRSTQSLMTT